MQDRRGKSFFAFLRLRNFALKLFDICLNSVKIYNQITKFLLKEEI